jgi:hypothetical protein
MNLTIQEFLLLRESKEFRKSFYQTSVNINRKVNWAMVIHLLASTFLPSLFLFPAGSF